MGARDYPKLLESKLKELFSEASARKRVRQLLEGYGKGEPEAERVRLAILKLAGQDLEEIKKSVVGAKEDFEDIIAWAERPRQTQCTLANRKMSVTELSRVQEQDRQEHEEWLGHG